MHSKTIDACISFDFACAELYTHYMHILRCMHIQFVFDVGGGTGQGLRASIVQAVSLG